MLSLTSTARIFLATGVTDMRRGFNGLYSLIEHQLGGEPLSGAIYGFCNRRRDAVKLFFFHEGGTWVCAKRLEQGTFRWPAAGTRTVEFEAAELHLLLSGIDLTWARQRRPWWQRPAPSTAPTGQSAPGTARTAPSPATRPAGRMP